MSNETPSIHDFEYQMICDYFSLVDRQGPGSPEVTVRALDFVGGLPGDARIADIGCGTGGQTLVLAQHAPGKITGIDLFPEFIGKLNTAARKAGLQDRVEGVTGDMTKLPFRDGELDLIWSEGAIYNIGFERGLKEWRRLLKKGGYIAVSEASWFTTRRPAEIESYWNAEYPEIDLVSEKIGQMERTGYIPIAAFTLPEECWTEHFYRPQESIREKFLEKYAGNKTAAAFVSGMQREAGMYEKFGAYYGYAFYIGRKV